MPNHLPNHPGATLVRFNADGTRVWRQRPIDFANYRTVAEVDAGQLVSRTNANFLPMSAGSQPQASAGRKVDSRSPGADVFNLNHGCRNAAQ
jgi:hypothetical protein